MSRTFLDSFKNFLEGSDNFLEIYWMFLDVVFWTFLDLLGISCNCVTMS